jgi:hypothetical protein
VSAIAIYVEGGGDAANTRAAIRNGFSAFLAPAKAAARRRAWHWRVVACGGREEAVRAFLHATENGEATVAVLLLDSEGPVTACPSAHVWPNGSVPTVVIADRVHLMVQLMETWLVADPAALAHYYGQGFLPNALPKAADLETVPKADILQKLSHATKHTKTKGLYHKIRHGADLLGAIDPAVVRLRCEHCSRLLNYLDSVIT